MVFENRCLQDGALGQVRLIGTAGRQMQQHIGANDALQPTANLCFVGSVLGLDSAYYIYSLQRVLQNLLDHP